MSSVGHRPAGRAQALQALAPGRGREPGTDPVGLLDPADVLGQAQPGGLEHVGRVGVAEPEGAGHRPHQPAEPFDQPAPRQPRHRRPRRAPAGRRHPSTLRLRPSRPRRWSPVAPQAASHSPLAASIGLPAAAARQPISRSRRVARPQHGPYPGQLLRTRLGQQRAGRLAAVLAGPRDPGGDQPGHQRRRERRPAPPRHAVEVVVRGQYAAVRGRCTYRAHRR